MKVERLEVEEGSRGRKEYEKKEMEEQRKRIRMRGKKEEKNVENIALGPERYLKPNLE